jgi:hypothetical protein
MRAGLFRNDPRVYKVLGHYDCPGAAGLPAWKERLTALPGVETCELSRLHGLLLAYGWLVQGPALGSDGRCLSACYRMTPAGQRALRHFISVSA